MLGMLEDNRTLSCLVVVLIIVFFGVGSILRLILTLVVVCVIFSLCFSKRVTDVIGDSLNYVGGTIKSAN